MREIPLTQGKVALVDDADYERVIQHRWFAARKGTYWYVARTFRKDGKHYMLRLANFILDVPLGTIVDHQDLNPFNNQRSNLRVATSSQNAMNRGKIQGTSSQYKGVSWHSRNSKWVARIEVNGRKEHLGTFLSEEDAARAYDKKALEVFGKFANLNFPLVVR